MTEKEAHIFFKHEEGDDLDALWETHFFKQKQYFLTHVPLQKVWVSQLKRLQKKYEGYMVLTHQMIENAPQEQDNQFDFNEDLIAAFNTYHQYRTEYKSKVLQAHSYFELKYVIESWLQMELAYAKHWLFPPSEMLEDKVFMSKEPDPMEMLTFLKNIRENKGVKTITDIKKGYNNLPIFIKKEVKRLTLLAKN